MNNVLRAAQQYYYSNTGESYSTEYQAVLDRATTEGITAPSSAINSAIDTFLSARVADGSYAVLDRLFVFPSLLGNFAKISLVRPATASLPTLVGQTTGGIKGNGTSTFTDTLYNPTTETSANYVQNSASRFFYLYTAPTTGTPLDGQAAGTANRSEYASVATHRINASANLTGGNVDFTGTGYRALNRSDATNCQLYKALSKFDRTAASAAPANQKFIIGASPLGFSDAVIPIWGAGGGLTETQHNNMNNDLVTLLTAFGL